MLWLNVFEWNFSNCLMIFLFVCLWALWQFDHPTQKNVDRHVQDRRGEERHPLKHESKVFQSKRGLNLMIKDNRKKMGRLATQLKIGFVPFVAHDPSFAVRVQEQLQQHETVLVCVPPRHVGDYVSLLNFPWNEVRSLWWGSAVTEPQLKELATWFQGTKTSFALEKFLADNTEPPFDSYSWYHAIW